MMTNLKKLQQMDKEQFIMFIINMTTRASKCKTCSFTCGVGQCMKQGCIPGIRTWLEQEVEDD